MPKMDESKIKSMAARARRERVAAMKSAMESKRKEDALWEEDESHVTKADMRRQERETKRQEASQKKAEVERLKKEEEEEMAKLSRKGTRGPKSDPSSAKITRAEILKMEEEELKRKEKEKRLREQREKRVFIEREYAETVEIENTNRLKPVLDPRTCGCDVIMVDARSVEDAIGQLANMALAVDLDAGMNKINGLHATLDKRQPDQPEHEPTKKGTEKCAKLSYKAYEAAELPRLRKECSKRTLHQCKEILWSRWKKNQEHL